MARLIGTSSDTGIAFAYIRATQGSNLVDPKFKTNVQKARAAHIPTGAYHFLSADDDPKAQAELFLNTVGRETNLRPVLAVELGNSLESNMRIWLQIVERATGCKPIIEA